MIGGEAAIGVMFSGDAIYVIGENDISFRPVTLSCWSIFVGAPWAHSNGCDFRAERPPSFYRLLLMIQFG